MYNKELVVEILTQISHAAKTVLQRFEAVTSVDYFIGSEEGLEKLDGNRINDLQ